MPYEGVNPPLSEAGFVIAGSVEAGEGSASRPAPRPFSKFVIDAVFCAVALPLIVVFGLILLVVNPVANKGPLFFRQERMGYGGRSFRVWKFRTMTACNSPIRAHDAPLEHHRITPLGRFLRRSRIDELPNAFNIIAGDMSLVGPRPDASGHARIYARNVRHYSARFAVRPGITGLAQVRSGYVDNLKGVARKARHDKIYIDRMGLMLDLHILWCTIGVVLFGRGAR